MASALLKSLGDDGAELAPWYMKILVRVGAPYGLLALVIWFLMSSMNAVLLNVKDVVAAHLEESHMSYAAELQFRNDLTAQVSLMVRLLRLNCVNQSATDFQRQACLQER